MNYPPSASPPRRDPLEVSLSLSAEITHKLSRVGLILTKRYDKRCTLEDVLEAMAEVFLEKLDPERRAEKVAHRALAKRANRTRKSAVKEAKGELKTVVPSQVKLGALRRDRNRCRHVSGGVRCGVSKRVDIFALCDSMEPRAAKIEDVTTLCPRHGRQFVQRISNPLKKG